MTSPAYQYGAILRAIKDAYVGMLEEISRGFRGERPRTQTSEDIEAQRVKLYRRQIEHERQLGLEYVRRAGRDARRELGP